MPLIVIHCKCLKKQKKCKHEFIRISNCWFHWNHGFSMCIGLCVKCGLQKDIKTSEIKYFTLHSFLFLNLEKIK